MFAVCNDMTPTDVLFVFDGAVDAADNVNEVYRDFIQSMIEMFRIGSNNTQVYPMHLVKSRSQL